MNDVEKCGPRHETRNTRHATVRVVRVGGWTRRVGWVGGEDEVGALLVQLFYNSWRQAGRARGRTSRRGQIWQSPPRERERETSSVS